MGAETITIAAVQSEITEDVRLNGRHIREMMTAAREAGARLAQFPEGALSGYVKSQVRDWDSVDWGVVVAELVATALHAGRLGLWTVVGCAHCLTAPHRPHNSLYVISDAGRLVGRYDKRLCSHSELSGWFTPAPPEPRVFDIEGFRFGCALCIEVKFPELFAEYERLGVDCVLLSAYAEDPVFDVLARAHAATNCYWVSLATPSQCAHRLPSALIGPDGEYVARGANDDTPGPVCGPLDRSAPEFATALTLARPWRALARSDGAFKEHRVADPRSTDLTSF